MKNGKNNTLTNWIVVISASLLSIATQAHTKAEVLNLQVCNGVDHNKIYYDKSEIRVKDGRLLLKVDGLLKTFDISEVRNLSVSELAAFNSELKGYHSRFGQAKKVRLFSTRDPRTSLSLAEIVDQKGISTTLALMHMGFILGTTHDCANPPPPQDIQCELDTFQNSPWGESTPLILRPVVPSRSNSDTLIAASAQGKGFGFGLVVRSLDGSHTKVAIGLAIGFDEGSGYTSIFGATIDFGTPVTPAMVARFLNKQNGKMNFYDQVNPRLHGYVRCE